MFFPYLYTDMSIKHAVIFSILSVSALVAYASTSNDTIAVTDTIRFDDGAWYLGEISDSLFNGYGKMVYADSTLYEGEWKDGLWDGQGEIYYPDGDTYKGSFHEHEFSGYGVYHYSDGATYDGYWKNGMFDGAGTMTYADGSEYTGAWMNDMKNGPGVLYESATGALYKGYFYNDQFIGTGQSQQAENKSNANPYYNIRIRPDSCWHYNGDSYVCLTYGTRQTFSVHADFWSSKRFFAGFSLGFNTINHKIGKVSVTYDDETGEKITLVGWDWYMDEVMTEHTYSMFKLAGECGVSWGWFSLGAAAGIGLQNTVRNCRSLSHNNSYYEPGTLYYREKITGAKFSYDIFTDFILSRNIPYIHSCSMRTGYSNIDGLYIGAGIIF